MDDINLREDVRRRYAEAALGVTTGGGCSCCGPDGQQTEAFGALLYGATGDEELPEAAVLASLGCGNPTAVADLRAGETVLDLGSGGGIDVLLSAKRVGPTGKVYGLDMTEEMLALAIENRRQAGATNVEFLKGYIEEVPLPAGTVDVVISNCVINLSTDKPRVLAEMLPRAAAGGADRDRRCRGRERPHPSRPGGARHLRRVHRRHALVRRVRGRPARRGLRRHLRDPDARGCPGHALGDHQGDQAGRGTG